MPPNTKHVFLCNRWLAHDEDDGQIERTLTMDYSSKLLNKEYSYLTPTNQVAALSGSKENKPRPTNKNNAFSYQDLTSDFNSDDDELFGSKSILFKLFSHKILFKILKNLT